MKRLQASAAVVGFLVCVVAANVLTARYGMVPVGLALVATAGTWAAGLALVARDAVHDFAGRLAVAGCIVAGAALSWWLTIPTLAVASAAAFAASELLDMGVYQPLRRRGWARAVVASSLAGGIADTLLFLWIAGYAITWATVGGQMLAKMTAALAVVGLVKLGKGVRRAVLRHRLRPRSA